MEGDAGEVVAVVTGLSGAEPRSRTCGADRLPAASSANLSWLMLGSNPIGPS